MLTEAMAVTATSIPVDERASHEAAAGRVTAMFDQHFVPVWRFLRRLGVPEADVDDCAQEVMLIATRKIDQVEEGKERAFLFGVAYRIASDARRAVSRRPELEGDNLDDIGDRAFDPEVLADRLRARALLDVVLEGMPLPYRTVFVLSEIDEMSMIEIAAVLGVPQGTVASRLRRGRAYFEARVKQVQARLRSAEEA